MEETPTGTPVGVDDPYELAGVCDHLTDDGRCRFALTQAGQDPAFARERRAAGYDCVAAADDVDWRDCPHYRFTTEGRSCARCGLEEVRMAHEDVRPLLEEHHLSYGGTADGSAAATVDGATAAAGEGTGDGTGDEDGTGDGDGTEAGDEPAHEITVALCRWCHAKVHNSIARVADDASPDPEAIAARERRRSREQRELGFSSARERRDGEE